MSHGPHTGPGDAVLYDGCEECDERAARPLMGLLHLDSQSFVRLRDRMLAVEGRTGEGYRSSNEASLGGALAMVRVLNQRHGAVL